MALASLGKSQLISALPTSQPLKPFQLPSRFSILFSFSDFELLLVSNCGGFLFQVYHCPPHLLAAFPVLVACMSVPYMTSTHRGQTPLNLAPCPETGCLDPVVRRDRMLWTS